MSVSRQKSREGRWTVTEKPSPASYRNCGISVRSFGEDPCHRPIKVNRGDSGIEAVTNSVGPMATIHLGPREDHKGKSGWSMVTNYIMHGAQLLG